MNKILEIIKKIGGKKTKAAVMLGSVIVPNTSPLFEDSLNQPKEEPHDIHKDYPVEILYVVSGFVETVVVKKVIIPSMETLKNTIVWRNEKKK